MKTILITCTLIMAGLAHAQEQFDSSQREAFRAALDACHSETGTARPAPGSPPNEEERSKMQACMTAKGYTLPDRPRRHGEHRRPASAGGQTQDLNEGQGAGAIQ